MCFYNVFCFCYHKHKDRAEAHQLHCWFNVIIFASLRFPMTFGEELSKPTEFCLYSFPSMHISHLALEYLITISSIVKAHVR